MAILYKTNGEKENIFPVEDKFELTFLQECVQGYSKRINLPKDNCIMIINEQGIEENLSYNKFATKLFLKNYPDSEDYIVGNCLICNHSELD